MSSLFCKPFQMAWLVQWLMRSMSELEMHFTSVQRVADMANITPEERHLITGLLSI